jgi:hypothetical protein
MFIENTDEETFLSKLWMTPLPAQLWPVVYSFLFFWSNIATMYNRSTAELCFLQRNKRVNSDTFYKKGTYSYPKNGISCGRTKRRVNAHGPLLEFLTFSIWAAFHFIFFSLFVSPTVSMVCPDKRVWTTTNCLYVCQEHGVQTSMKHLSMNRKERVSTAILFFFVKSAFTLEYIMVRVCVNVLSSNFTCTVRYTCT